MSSRGAKAKNGHVTTDEYKMKSETSFVLDAKVLVGRKHAHSLPDYAHTPSSKYIKENSDGSFREMRIYGDEGEPLLEIGYHCEKPLTGNNHEKVLHYHTFNIIDTVSIDRTKAKKLDTNSDIYNKYKDYLKRYGL